MSPRGPDTRSGSFNYITKEKQLYGIQGPSPRSEDSLGGRSP